MPTVQVTAFRDLSTVIKAVRESQEVRQEELANSLAITTQYLRAMESGRSNLFITRLFRVLNRLGIRLSVTYELPRRGASDG